MQITLTRAPTASVAVVGAGPAGLVAALALARAGASVSIAAPRPTPDRLAADTRTFAAMGGSVELLKALGVWDALQPFMAPLRAIRLIDDRGRLLRAPEVLFEASEAGLDAFGANIPQAALGAVLSAAVLSQSSINWHDTLAVEGVTPTADHVSLRLADGTDLRAGLVVAADGRQSIGRAAAGIGTKAWSYPQSAVACVFGHTRPHDGISTEFHRQAGPLTTVPMPNGPLWRDIGGPRSSLVWVETPERAAALKAMPDVDFLAELGQRLQGLLGSLTHIEPRAAFPLSGLEAETMARNRIALVGEAGHVLPPIGAQGLNLGLRDAATLADCVDDALRAGDDIGGDRMLAVYARRRSADVSARTFAVDLLNRSLLSSAVPFDAARGLGLHALALSSTLRKAAMRHGLEPIGARPRLMQTQVG